MKRDLVLITLGLAGFVACARGGSDLDGIDPFDDQPIDGAHANDGGSTGDGSIGDGGGGDGGGGSNGDALPIGTISYFDRACPTGWTPYATVVGRTIVPTNDGATLVTSGNAYASGESRTHAHSVAFSFDLTGVRYVLASGGANGGLGQVQTVVGTGSSAVTNATLPYVQLMACQKTAAPIAGTVPVGLTAYFESSMCPAGWNRLASTQGRIVFGTPAGGTNDMAFGSATPLTSGESRDHTHPLTGNWTPASHGIAGLSGCCSSYYAEAKAYSYNTTSGVENATPPYLALTHCRRT